MQTNRILANRYKLEQAIGIGGMSEVYKAKDLKLDRDIAVKILKEDLSKDLNAYRRFRKEALNAASLNHPYIVSVFDSGEFENESAKLPYIVMEYVKGNTLRELITSNSNPIEISTSLKWIKNVCSALSYLHEHNIIHRDIKPSNIMITERGNIKVMDFGIARTTSDITSTMTQTAAVIGTAQYLSPEQARGEKTNHSSDIYSLGCVLYELLTKKPPFLGDTPISVAYQHVRKDPTKPSILNPSVSPELDAVVLKTLNKNPINRYISANELYTDIDKLLKGEKPNAPLLLPGTYNNNLIDTPHPDIHTNYKISSTDIKASSSSATQTSLLETVKNLDNLAKKNKPAVIIFSTIAALLLAIIIGIKLFYFLFPPTKKQVIIPSVINLSSETAQQKLTTMGFLVLVKTTPNETIEINKAIKTIPLAGTKIQYGSKIILEISTGPKKIEIPNLLGKTETEAKDILIKLGLKVDNQIKQHSSKPELKDRVVATTPEIGTTISIKQPVTLFLGKGVENDFVPNVVGKSVEEAQKILETNGFKVATGETDSELPAGIVAQTSPSAGSTISDDTTITILTSRNNMIAMPDLTNLTEKQAENNLKKLGFIGNLKVIITNTLDLTTVNKILSQDKPAGNLIKKDETIVVTIGKFGI